MTLDRILKSQGFGTRRACRALILDGAVVIGGKTVSGYGEALQTANLLFSVQGEPWSYRERLYVALNKPPNFECSRKPSHHPGVLSLLPIQFSRRATQSVGRLDHDTTGLLLLSDDGAFIHAQTAPRRQVAKTYVAHTHEPVTPQLVRRLLCGVQLADEPAPIAAQACHQLDTRSLQIVLAQGKYHQVKRMLVAAGNHCVALQRSAIGGLQLEALALSEGEWCHLAASQLTLLAQATANAAGSSCATNAISAADDGILPVYQNGIQG